MDMNSKQKKLGFIVVGILFLMSIYPPMYSFARMDSIVIFNKYDWIFNATGTYNLDFVTLLTQWFMVLIVGAILFFLLKDRK